MVRKYFCYSDRFKQIVDGKSNESLEDYVMSFLPKIEYMIARLNVDEKYHDDLVQAGFLGVIEALSISSLDDKKTFCMYLNNLINRKFEETFRGMSAFSGFGTIRDLYVLYNVLGQNNTESSDKKEFFNLETLSYSEDIDDDFALETEDVMLSETIRTSDLRKIEEDALDVDIVLETIDLLDERTQFVIIHYLGLFGNKAKPFQQIANVLGVSRPRVSEIYKNGIKKLKKYINGLTRTLKR